MATPEWIYSALFQITCTVSPLAFMIVRSNAKSRQQITHLEKNVDALVVDGKDQGKAREKLWAAISRHDTRISVVESKIQGEWV